MNEEIDKKTTKVWRTDLKKMLEMPDGTPSDQVPSREYTLEEWETAVKEIEEWQKLHHFTEKIESPLLVEPINVHELIEKAMKDFEKENTETDEGLNLYPKPILWSDFSKINFPPERWRIKKLMPMEGFTIMAAPSGEKKTWIALEMVRSIATGTPFLGNPDFESIAGNVLYIDQEMPRAELQKRGRLLGFDKAINKVWLISKDDLNLNNEEMVDWLFDFIEKNKIGVLFVDTLRAVAGGLKEEKAEEVRIFFNRFKPAKDKGISIIFLDHCRKPSAYEGKIPKKEQLFASQDKLASVEVLLMLRSEEANDEIFMYQRKSRISKEVKPFKAVIEDVIESDGKETLIIKYGGEFDEKETKKEQAKEIILSLLVDGGKVRQEIIKMVYSIAKIGEKNVSEALRELEEEKKISMKKEGKQNFYSLTKNEETVSTSL